MSDKTKADWIREFADAMEADPDGWWRGYEWRDGMEWLIPADPTRLPYAVLRGHFIRRRPRTVTRYDRHGEAVELPASVVGGEVFAYIGLEAKDKHADAKAWADYFRSLLETGDD